MIDPVLERFTCLRCGFKEERWIERSQPPAPFVRCPFCHDAKVAYLSETTVTPPTAKE